MIVIPLTVSQGFSFVILAIIFSFPSSYALADVQVSIPSNVQSDKVVFPNFLGISFELSFLDEYFGNDTSTIPPAALAYLSALRARTLGKALRLRIGGNSMDSSTYLPDQTGSMVQLTNPDANSNNQPVNYGPMVWDVLKSVGDSIGGAEYLIGLSLLDPNNPDVPLLAGGAQKGLGNDLDAFLLGNEPDLYTDHGNRPNLKNYTLDNYLDEFSSASDHLTNTSAGNILERQNLGGPTICCNWNLDAVLQNGYLSAFDNVLKYISLQHYPQNNCFNGHKYELDYYMRHAEVVNLASWQQPGISLLLSQPPSTRPSLIMSEFNSASCGGLPNMSDTFAVGSLWTVDYALQMASRGYSAAYLHTRERGISYNLFAPPPSDDPSGAWTTNSPYYALLATAEALQSASGTGSLVVDLQLSNSTLDMTATVAGYGVFDAQDSSVQQVVLFNYANDSSAAFALPAIVFSGNSWKREITVKYLSSTGAAEKTNITWGGQTLNGVGDGKLVNDPDWAQASQKVDCTNGCNINVPAPGLAVVFAHGPPKINGAVSRAWAEITAGTFCSVIVATFLLY